MQVTPAARGSECSRQRCGHAATHPLATHVRLELAAGGVVLELEHLAVHHVLEVVHQRAPPAGKRLRAISSEGARSRGAFGARRALHGGPPNQHLHPGNHAR